MPWVPRDLYDLMVDSLRVSRGLVLSDALVGTAVDAPAVKPDPMPAPAEPVAPMLSPVVHEACVRFAFGDPNEKAMNLALANRLLRDGCTDGQIIAHVRAGGQPVTV
jgi:hypothetical protein